MSSRGKRYESEPKLNIKKVISVIIAILVVVMFIIGIKELLKDNSAPKTKTFATGYYTVYENGKWGVIDTKLNKVIDAEYDEMIAIPDNTKPVFIITTDTDYENGTFNTKVLDDKSKQLYTDYDKVEVIYNHDKSNNLWFEKNVLKVQKDGKYGLINLDGTELLACSYDDIKPIEGSKNVLITVKDEKQGVVNTTGTLIINNEYEKITTVTDKYEDGFIVKNDSGKYGVANSSGKVVVDVKYDDVKNVYGNKMYVVKEDDTWEIIDEEGNTYLKDKFDDVKQINIDNIVISKDKKYGIVTTDGEAVLDTEYEDLSFIFTDTYIAKKDGKYGIITVSKEEKLPFEYSFIKYESEANFIRAQKDTLNTQLLDREFNVKAEGIVSEINTDKNYIRLRSGEEYKYYNLNLEEKTPQELLTGNTLFLSKKDGKYGYVNENGIVVVDYKYDDATEQNKYGYVSVKKDGKWGSLDQTGKVVLEPTYTLENNLVIDFIGDWHLAEDINANYYTK